MASSASRLPLRPLCGALLRTRPFGISATSTTSSRGCSSSSSELWPNIETSSFEANEGFGTNIASGGNQTTTTAPRRSFFPLRAMRVSPQLERQTLRAINKAIIAGEVGKAPVQKVRRNGHILTIFPIGTGGMFRSPISSIEAKIDIDGLDNRLQWHKITIHDERLGRFAMLRLRKGMKVYVEGEVETRVFNDPQTGLIKRDREIAVRTSGRLMSVNENGAFEIDSILI